MGYDLIYIWFCLGFNINLCNLYIINWSRTSLDASICLVMVF